MKGTGGCKQWCPPFNSSMHLLTAAAQNTCALLTINQQLYDVCISYCTCTGKALAIQSHIMLIPANRNPSFSTILF